MYRPAHGTKLSGTETEFYSDLDILFTDASISVIIMGDFNIHFNDEPKSSRLRNMLNDYQMQQHVHSATHEHGNVLDLVINTGNILYDMYIANNNNNNYYYYYNTSA